MNSKIEPVPEFELTDMQKSRLAEIRFSCIVQMFDYGQKSIQPSFLSFQDEKFLPPQWFKLDYQITLEAIKHSDPTALGLELKKAFELLENHIKKYEKR